MALKGSRGEPTHYLSGYGQLEEFRNKVEKRIGDKRFCDLYFKVRGVVRRR